MSREEHPGPACYCGSSGCIEQFVSGPALVRALAHVVNLLDPDVIVLGGGVSNLEQLYAEVPPLLARYVYARSFDTPLLRAAHGDASGVRGAAMLWDQT
jgi:fructokinase